MFGGFFWIFLEKGGIAILQFATLIILGRLLTPSDYGIYGTMIIFISIIEALIESGLGGAIIQKKKLVQEDINTLFFFNLGFSIIAYIALFFCAPLLYKFYHIEHLTTYFRVLGITLIFYALSLVQISMMNRNLLFRKSAIINLSANILSAIIAIAMAYYGLGVWALIAQVILTSVFLAIFYWISNRIAITLSVSKQSFIYMWKFGIHTVGAVVLQNIVNNLTTSVIPKIGTITQSGYYFQASRVNNVPTGILTQCIDKGVFPTLSKEQDTQAIVSKARELNRYFLTLAMPIFPLIAFCAEAIIITLLGETWKEASLYLFILAWGGIALIIQVVSRNIIKATGATKYILFVEIVKSLITLVVLFAAMRWGVLYMVWGFVIATYIGAMVWMWILHIKMNYRFSMQLKDIAGSLFLSMFLYGIMYLGHDIMGWMSKSIWLLPIGYAAYWLLGLITKNHEIIELTRKCLDILPHRRKHEA